MAKALAGAFFLTAHPDDEFLHGGLIRRLNDSGIHTTLMCLTCGGRIRNPAAVSDDDVCAVRSSELLNSCEQLGGTELVWGGVEDGGSNSWDRDALVDSIVGELEARRPTLIVTAAPQISITHPDHLAACEITEAAYDRIASTADSANVPLLVYGFGVPRKGLGAILSRLPAGDEKTQRLHRIASALPPDNEVKILSLNEDELESRLSIPKCHRSQFPDSNGLYYGLPYQALSVVGRWESYRVERPAELAGTDPLLALRQ